MPVIDGVVAGIKMVEALIGAGITTSKSRRLRSAAREIGKRMNDKSYPRDLIGHGPNPPHADWPGGARLAVQFVINYEEGGENNILHGDAASEAFLSEIVGAQPWPGARHMSMGVDLRVWQPR